LIYLPEVDLLPGIHLSGVPQADSMVVPVLHLTEVLARLRLGEVDIPEAGIMEVHLPGAGFGEAEIIIIPASIMDTIMAITDGDPIGLTGP
jgi:hypothetical protein